MVEPIQHLHCARPRLHHDTTGPRGHIIFLVIESGCPNIFTPIPSPYIPHHLHPRTIAGKITGIFSFHLSLQFLPITQTVLRALTTSTLQSSYVFIVVRSNNNLQYLLTLAFINCVYMEVKTCVCEISRCHGHVVNVRMFEGHCLPSLLDLTSISGL